jgi:hypothetical protein
VRAGLCVRAVLLVLREELAFLSVYVTTPFL